MAPLWYDDIEHYRGGMDEDLQRKDYVEYFTEWKDSLEASDAPQIDSFLG